MHKIVMNEKNLVGVKQRTKILMIERNIIYGEC